MALNQSKNSKNKFLTPQPKRAVSMFSSSLSRKNNKTGKSVGRFIPSQVTYKKPFLPNVLEDSSLDKSEKILHKSDFTKEKKIESSRTKIKNDQFFVSPKKNNVSKMEESNMSSEENSDASRQTALEKSVNMSSICLRTPNNEGSFCASPGRRKNVHQDGSPCKPNSKSASKRARSELNSAVFRLDERFLQFKKLNSQKDKLSFERFKSPSELVRVMPQRNFSAQKKAEERYLKISKTSEKVLDAPNLRKSTQLNLLNWGKSPYGDVLAAALADEVYFWYTEKQEIETLSSLSGIEEQEDHLVSALLWFGGSFLAVARKQRVDVFSFQPFWMEKKKNSSQNPKKKIKSKMVVKTHTISVSKEFKKEKEIISLSWMEKRRLIVTFDRNGIGAVHKLSKGKGLTLAVLKGPRKGVCRQSWCPSGKILAASCLDGSCYLYSESDIFKMALKMKKKPLEGFLDEIVSSDTESRLILPFAEIKINENGVFNSNTRKNGFSVANSDGFNRMDDSIKPKTTSLAVKAAVWCPWNSSTLVVGSEDGYLSLFEGVGRLRGVLKSPSKRVRCGNKPVTGAEFLPRYKELITSHDHIDGNGIMLWSMPQLTVLATLRGHTGGVLGLVASKSFCLVASGGRDETIRIWRVVSEEERERNKNDFDDSFTSCR